MNVSIITINYNSSEYTIKLVNSILNKVSKNITYEIIITDNASESDDYNNLITKLEDVLKSKITSTEIKSLEIFFGEFTLKPLKYIEQNVQIL